jgi:uncharacterized protein YndB with AHSA1/START domain
VATQYSVTRLIDAPIDRVWSLLSDASEQARWNDTLVSIEGTIADGGAVTIVSKVNPKRTFTLKVSEVAPPNRMVWSDGMPLGLFKGTRTFELKDAAGKTEFSMVEGYSGALAGLITRSIPDMTDSFKEYADALQQAAEASA